MKSNESPWNKWLSPEAAKDSMITQSVPSVPQENTTPSTPFSGVLIAGGRSTRMKEDKASLLFNGIPMWRHQIAILEQAGASDIFISGPPDGPWKGGSWRSFPDKPPQSGPICGLLAALLQSRHSLTACLAVDMPGMKAGYMRGLIEEAAKFKTSVVPRMNGRWEPLAAAYHRDILPVILKRMEVSQHSLQELLDSALTLGLVIPQQVNQDASPLFWNSNTPAEWNAFTSRG